MSENQGDVRHRSPSKERLLDQAQTRRKAMTAAEIVQHAEFPYVIWLLTPTRKERVAVARGRGGPFRIAYEIHGNGPIKIVWIMGLGSLKSGWQNQTKAFAHQQLDKYSCLILDNRGIGESDKPVMRYSTSEMARDVVEILDHVGWTADRLVHVVGISMGGMIAQELAGWIPERIASLNLVSTGCRIRNTVGFFENFCNRASLFIPSSIDSTLDRVRRALFTTKFLCSPDEFQYTKQAFPTSGDRCMAVELYKRNDATLCPRFSFILQAIAAGWHHKSPQQLAAIADAVGRERIMVMHGTEDRMISFPHGQELADGLSRKGEDKEDITIIVYPGQGHVIPVEKRHEFNEHIKQMIEKTTRPA